MSEIIDSDSDRSSELGTREYWESCYRQEINNYNDYQDIGEIWFGSSLVAKIVGWITTNLADKSSRIVEIGCGNGHLIIKLNEKGFNNLTALDYADNSIELTRQLCNDNNISNIALFVEDFLNLSDSLLSSGKFRLAIDKGTFDAICLNPNTDRQAVKQKYIKSLDSILDKDGLLLIASCNWTRDELVQLFQGSKMFNLVDSIETPIIKFGGKTGNSVACLIFKHV